MVGYNVWLCAESCVLRMATKEKDILDEEIGDFFKVLKHSEITTSVKHELKTKETSIPFKNSQIIIHEDVLQERGYRLWKACHFLVTYLGKFSETEFKGKRAIELGSGTGLGGIALAHLGANVTLTDFPSVLPILQINIDANTSRNSSLQGLLSVAPLTWGEDISSFTTPNNAPPLPSSSPSSSPPPSSPLSAPNPLPVDIILASDVLYSEEAHTPLLYTLAALSTPQTQIIFSYERRKKSNDRFFKKASKWFEWTTLGAGEIIEGSEDKVTIYLMRKRLAPTKKGTGRVKEREGKGEKAKKSEGKAEKVKESEGGEKVEKSEG
eukprot:Phypoly_transcript_05050.p1 GENE.Phypoly_transcript_05050~~Phypoly_transcript_05050.p1  ORF type:complete len:324 (+),score=96.92 Phypoly_transcript_05050:1053-2024(+)